MNDMNEIEKVIYINELLNIYRDLLSITQSEILSEYYESNLSISEISNERNISRSAVEDALKKGVKKLEEYEKKLQILGKNKKLLELTKQLRSSGNIEKTIKEIEEVIK